MIRPASLLIAPAGRLQWQDWFCWALADSPFMGWGNLSELQQSIEKLEKGSLYTWLWGLRQAKLVVQDSRRQLRRWLAVHQVFTFVLSTFLHLKSLYFYIYSDHGCTIIKIGSISINHIVRRLIFLQRCQNLLVPFLSWKHAYPNYYRYRMLYLSRLSLPLWSCPHNFHFHYWFSVQYISGRTWHKYRENLDFGSFSTLFQCRWVSLWQAGDLVSRNYC